MIMLIYPGVVLMSISIREAVPQDAAVITYHRRRMFEDMGRASAAIEDMEQRFLPWVEAQLTSKRYLGWFATFNGEVVAGAGLLLMDWPPHVLGRSTLRGNIINVYTEPECRRQGLARQLTQLCIDWCWANDIDVIILHASDEGRALYESMGFRASNEVRLTRA
jgi:GNAT superfamily N-acetyltransferase